MPRKPVDQLRTEERREAVWAVIRQAKTFTVTDLCKEIDLSRDAIRDYVRCLEKAGIVEREPLDETSIGQALIFHLVPEHDPGPEAPRVRKDGSEVTQGRGREAMWAVMKALKTFTALDVAVTASNDQYMVALSEAKHYIGYLSKSGYLAVITPGKPGGTKTPGKLARYRFIRNTGPKPPMVQKCAQVWDPNLKKVVWTGVKDIQPVKLMGREVIHDSK